jgi:hypothetical protein
VSSKASSYATARRDRYVVQRERGSDWCVADTRFSHLPVVAGLDKEEADKTAAQWNKATRHKNTKRHPDQGEESNQCI